MKPSTQSSKGGPSNSKTKKSGKDREKRKSQGGTNDVNNHTSTEKGSPTKDSNNRLYAGIDADSIIIYTEQTAVEHLSETITNTLTEDINYKLRYIINDCLLKARLSGRNAISSADVEQAFDNLKIGKVYGAPAHPNWVPFGYQNLYYLDDKQINLVEIAEEENIYYQHAKTILTNKWVPEKEISKSLKNYFTTMCEAIVSSDTDVRNMALTNISENPRIGPITEWLYNFGYILLSKDITYDCLTLRALDLIKVLETSPNCRINVSEKVLKLLIRLILQRLLKSLTTNEVLKPMCNILAIICQREPLKEFVILKILQKLGEIFYSYALPIVTTANCLGIDAIKIIILPHLDLLLHSKVEETKDLPFIYSILETYHILCKEDLLNSTIYEWFYECFGDGVVIFNQTVIASNAAPDKKEMNFATIKRNLLKTRQKVDPNVKIFKVKRKPKILVNCIEENEETSHSIVEHIEEGFIEKIVPIDNCIEENEETPQSIAEEPIEEACAVPVEKIVPIEKVFDMPSGKCRVRKKLDEHKWNSCTRETMAIIGKSTLLLPIFKQKKYKHELKCSDHTLLSYNI